MKTEITENKKLNGWVLYDADCPLCVRLARRFQSLLAGRRFELLPLQSPWIRARLGLEEPELLAEIRLLLPDGKIFGGVDALFEISRHYRLAWPVRQLAQIPLVNHLFHQLYRWIARNRHCADGACGIHGATLQKRGGLIDYLPLVVLPLVVWLFRPRLASWVFMWGMALALYAGSKWLTYRKARRKCALKSWWRVAGYLLAWPGMNAAEFLNPNDVPARPRKMEWFLALAKTGLGFVLLFGVAGMLLPDHPLVAGWVGMIGAIFILHFGLFHVMSLIWRRAGVNAVPLMRNPLWAKSLAEFWGQRWNAAFHELAFRFAYRPLRRRMTPAMATLGVFGVSGLIHELVISLPARGGYGLPTAYFVLQGLGLVLDRTRFGRRIGLARGLRRRFFTIAITAVPAFYLFHPPFIRNVILPMLNAIGAT